MVGLGYAAVRSIPVDKHLRMDLPVLEQTIAADQAAGHQPFLLIGTAGTTGGGAIDSLTSLADIAQRHDLWFHVDAAYGGAAILDPQLQPFLAGIERSDSITFDAHKWLSVPMGASMFLTSHRDILGQTFRITTDYMPKDAGELTITDPFTHSVQ